MVRNICQVTCSFAYAISICAGVGTQYELCSVCAGVGTQRALFQIRTFKQKVSQKNHNILFRPKHTNKLIFSSSAF